MVVRFAWRMASLGLIVISGVLRISSGCEISQRSATGLTTELLGVH